MTLGTGSVQGTVSAGQRAFLGIPYAAPPVATLRWKPPQAHEAWITTREAKRFSVPCAQPITDAQGRPAILGNEDCLYLNVYGPVEGTPLPVLVFIHGGAYRNGAGSDYDAAELSRKGQVVVVTVNYRLGVFGFLAHPGLTSESPSGASGQYGLLDQRFALEWVKRNIAAFGGDPGNTTLMGQSSGAYSVCNQLASPSSVGLFHKVILESGACTSRSASLPLVQAEAAGAAFAETVGCSGGDATACLRGVAMACLVGAVATERIGSSLGWAPAAGGTLWPKSSADATAAGELLRVPTLSGTNHDEYRVFAALQELGQGGPISAGQYTGFVNGAFGGGANAVLAAYPPSAFAAPDVAQSALLTDFAFACPVRTTANVLSANVETYVYEFDDPTAPKQVPGPFIDQRAYHGAELTFLFRQPMSAWGFGPLAALDVNQQALADQMIKYWGSFAATGNPNNAGSPTWPRYFASSQGVQRLAQGAVSTIFTFGADHRCDLWAGFGA
ncbi:MAG: carboxylesterase family protein [Betaproteobacteria bacterium]